MTGGMPIDDETKKRLADENADKGPRPESGSDPQVPTSDKGTDNAGKAAGKASAKAAPLSDKEKYGGYKPRYVNLGDKPKGFFKRIGWTSKLLRERRKLRKDLRAQGIKKYVDFDNTARELGLGLDRNTLLGWFWWKWLGLTQTFGIKGLMIAAGLLAGALFAMSYLTDFKGSFTINLTADMIRNGYILCETSLLDEPKSRLISDEVTVNNITFDDIARDVDLIDGPHNGTSYLAMTFYISNAGENVNNVIYTVSMLDSIFNVDKVTWLMLYMDGKQVVYAQPNSNGTAERLYGYKQKPPFYDDAYDPELQYYQKDDGKWGVATTMFESDNTVVRGVMLDVQPGETHKFTIVIWIEGWDPECTNDIQGGYAKFEMEFDVIEPENARRGIFDGIYRTDYDDYMNGKVSGSGDSGSDGGKNSGNDNPGEMVKPGSGSGDGGSVSSDNEPNGSDNGNPAPDDTGQ